MQISSLVIIHQVLAVWINYYNIESIIKGKWSGHVSRVILIFWLYNKSYFQLFSRIAMFGWTDVLEDTVTRHFSPVWEEDWENPRVRKNLSTSIQISGVWLLCKASAKLNSWRQKFLPCRVRDFTPSVLLITWSVSG